MRVRIPLSHDLESRTNDVTKDARIVNGYTETVGQTSYVVKRPGLASFTITPAITSSNAQGCYYFKGDNRMYFVYNNTLYAVTAAGASSVIGTVAAGLYKFSETSDMPYLVLQSDTNAYTYNAKTLVFNAITDVNFPTKQTPAMTLVPGVVYLDDTIYMMTTTGRIYNSNIEDPTTWNALNYLVKSSEPDGGVGMCKHLSYIVAFGKWSTEFFYDNANPTGSPLARNDTAKLEIGCASATTIVQVMSNESVMWVGQTREMGRVVYMLNGLKPTRISTKAIENYLNVDPMINTRAWSVNIAGHLLYVLTLHDSNFTFVYNIREKTWSQWTAGTSGAYFSGEFSCSDMSGNIYIQQDLGVVSKLSTSTYQDNGVPFNFRIITPKFDNNNNNRKFWFSVEAITDKYPVGTTLSIRHSNDDYTTWSSFRTVDLSFNRSIIYQLGDGRRKAFDILYTANQPLRIEGIEAEVTEGGT